MELLSMKSIGTLYQATLMVKGSKGSQMKVFIGDRQGWREKSTDERPTKEELSALNNGLPDYQRRSKP